MRNVIILVVLAVLSRLLPHPPNFTPMISIALLSGAFISNRMLSFILPLTIVLISDMFLGMYSGMMFVYLGYVVSTYIGYKMREQSNVKIINASLLSGILFWTISNLGVYLLSNNHDVASFILCYTMAIPFLPALLVSSVIYSVVLSYFYNIISYKLESN